MQQPLGWRPRDTKDDLEFTGDSGCARLQLSCSVQPRRPTERGEGGLAEQCPDRQMGIFIGRPSIGNGTTDGVSSIQLVVSPKTTALSTALPFSTAGMGSMSPRIQGRVLYSGFYNPDQLGGHLVHPPASRQDSFNKCLLSSLHVPDTVLGEQDR